MSNQGDKTALVLGGSGSFGGAVALELAARGWRLRFLARTPSKVTTLVGDRHDIEVVQGDATDADAVADAARGMDVVVHGVNYPYAQWRPNMMVVTDAILAAAEKTGARILFPGNVYGYGDQTGRPLDENTPNNPCSRKGELRVEIEDKLKASAEAGRSRTLIVRGGDYFGPTVRNGLVDMLFGNAARGKAINWIGDLDIPHQWCYVPDIARMAADLLEREDALAPFEVVHDAGHIAEPQRDFLQATARAANKPGLKIKVLPWWMVRTLGFVDGNARELMEMRYLFDHSIILDDRRRRELLPDFTHTPIDDALANTIASYRLTRK